MLELFARVVINLKDYISPYIATIGALDAYEIKSENDSSLWILKAGYKTTFEDALKEKVNRGAFLGVEALNKMKKEFKLTNESILMQINSDGFKGPEIDKEHKFNRILTIGDSCTFGTMFDRFSYPRVMQRSLNENGIKSEVINAGVEGYGPKQVLKNMNKYLGLQPEIVTIYIGWNALFGDYNEKYSYHTWYIIQKVYKKFYQLYDPQKAAEIAYKKEKVLSKKTEQYNNIQSYSPSFINDLESIINQFREKGIKVVLMTLPGLYSTDIVPSEKALNKGHLPTFTDNPYVLAKMSENYNNAIRKIAKEKEIDLIDLDKWANSNLTPKEKYFSDSVHLYEEGQRLLGEYIANELVRLNAI